MDAKLVMKKEGNIDIYVLYVNDTRTKYKVTRRGKGWACFYSSAFRGYFDSREQAFFHIKEMFFEVLTNEYLKIAGNA